MLSKHHSLAFLEKENYLKNLQLNSKKIFLLAKYYNLEYTPHLLMCGP